MFQVIILFLLLLLYHKYTLINNTMTIINYRAPDALDLECLEQAFMNSSLSVAFRGRARSILKAFPGTEDADVQAAIHFWRIGFRYKYPLTAAEPYKLDLELVPSFVLRGMKDNVTAGFCSLYDY